MACHLSPNPLDSEKANTLEVIIKVQSTLFCEKKAFNGYVSHLRTVHHHQ